MAARRQLPILNQKMAPPAGSTPGLEGDDDERPPWHWSAIGAVLVFTIWLPLSMVGQWASSRLLASMIAGGSAAEVEASLAAASAGLRWGAKLAAAGPALLSFAAACVAGGACVGRFGGKAGAREATVAAVVAASVAWALVAAGVGLGAAVLWPPLAGLGALFGHVGGRIGLRLRAPSRGA